MIQLRRKTEKLPLSNYYTEDKENIRNQDRNNSKSRSHLSTKNNSLDKNMLKPNKQFSLVNSNADRKKKEKSASKAKQNIDVHKKCFTKKLLHQLKSLQDPNHLSYDAHLALNRALFSDVECSS